MERRFERGAGEGLEIYERWLEKEGIPVYKDIAGVEDITELPRRPWARLGGLGTYIELEGTRQGRKGLYVAEIPGGGALEPERHLYDELIYILRGRGLTEVWHEGKDKRKLSFEWGEGSLFAIPLNAWHRLVNGGRQPVLLFGQTSAPLLIQTLRTTEFILNCDYNFTDRYTGQDDYFLASKKQTGIGGVRGSFMWETNFVPDMRTIALGNTMKVEDGQLSAFRMASWSGVHSSDWPSGKYHKAHYHGPAAILLGLKSEGYVLLWPRSYGIHPFQDGHGDKVVRVDWKPGGIYCPPNEWFHAHFNTGAEPARHLATTGGGVGAIEIPQLRGQTTMYFTQSVRDGGSLIEYEDEDPEIRRMFKEELRKKGIKFTMKPVVYRTDPFMEPL